jgi:hypothetical protein
MFFGCSLVVPQNFLDLSGVVELFLGDLFFFVDFYLIFYFFFDLNSKKNQKEIEKINKIVHNMTMESTDCLEMKQNTISNTNEPTVEQMIEKAMKYKEIGNELFKKQVKKNITTTKQQTQTKYKY